MNLFQQKISLYNGVKDNKGKPVDSATVVAAIKDSHGKLNGHFLEGITRILRATPSGDKRDDYKKSFPGVTWSGEFKKRISTDLETNLVHYTGYICLDIDKLDATELKLVRKRLMADIYTCLLFVSPSDNGLKILFWHEQGPHKHLDVFLQMQEHIESMYGVKVDPSGKDICRLCFVPHDANIYVTETRTPFDYVPPTDKNLPQPQNGATLSIQDNYKTPRPKSDRKKSADSGIQPQGLDWVRQCTEEKHQYVEGNRNNYVHFFACVANREGIAEAETLSYMEAFATGMKGSEVKASVKSAYKQNAAEHGQSINRRAASVSNRDSRVDSTTPAAANSRGGGNGGNKPPVKTQSTTPAPNGDAPQFWKLEEDDKGRKQIKLLYNELIDFLTHQGFHRAILKEGEKARDVVFAKSNVVHLVDLLDVKDFVFDYLKEAQHMAVLEMCRRGAKNYFSAMVIEGLPRKLTAMRRETEHESFGYFRTGAVRITADAVAQVEFGNMEGSVWASKLINHQLSLLKPEDYITISDAEKKMTSTCDAARFIWHVSHNDNDHADTVPWESRLQRFMAHVTSMGYLLHEYKNPALTKAIVGVDHVVTDKFFQDGGTGKSLWGGIAAAFRKLTVIDGKQYRDENPFKLEMITIDSKIYFLDDVRPAFDFEGIFPMLTGPFTLNRKNQSAITIPFEDSGKIYISTNNSLRGQGKSFKRRQHVIEFSDFFSEDNKPVDFFGRNFFSGWDAEQWNLFYNFLIWCIQGYLKDGLIEYPSGNYEQNKLINESTPEFLDFMDELERNRRYDKVDLFNQYKDIHKQSTGYNFSAASFYKWTKRYAGSRGLVLNGHVDKYDKASGKEYYTLWQPDFLEKYKGAAIELKRQGKTWTKMQLVDFAEGKMF